MRRHSITYALLISTFALAGLASAQQELYVHGSDGVLYRVDNYATNPSAVVVGATGISALSTPTDIAVDPANGDLYFCAFNSAFSSTEIWRVDPVSLATTQLPASGTTDRYNAMDIAGDGTIYCRSSATDALATFDKVTGAETVISTNMQAAAAGDVATDLDGTLITTNENGGLDRYNLTTGLVTDLGSHGLGTFAYGIEIDVDGTIYIITNVGDIYTYDLASANSTLVGSLGITVFGCAFTITADGGVGPGLGTTYCVANNNSTGTTSKISAAGSLAVADNDVTLSVADLPLNAFGFFIVAPTQIFIANPGGSAGNLCVSSPGRYVGPGQIQSSGQTGTFSLTVDLTMIPSPLGFLTTSVGDTWNFQAWHRDAVGGSTTSNFSNGLEITFN